MRWACSTGRNARLEGRDRTGYRSRRPWRRQGAFVLAFGRQQGADLAESCADTSLRRSERDFLLPGDLLRCQPVKGRKYESAPLGERHRSKGVAHPRGGVAALGSLARIGVAADHAEVDDVVGIDRYRTSHAQGVDGEVAGDG